MSDLTFNKVAGALLATGLAVVGLRELATSVFTHHDVEKPGYAIQVAEAAGQGGGAAADVPPDWGTVLPTADVKAGEAVFAKCKSCHTVDQGGANGTGPNLWAIVGRKPGAHAGFAYSPVMAEYGGKQPAWDYEHINEFVKSPGKYMAGTKMTFVGLKKPEDRINLIAYLHTLGSTLPIPAPAPAAAAAPADSAAASAADSAAAPADAAAAPAASAPVAAVPAAAPAGAH